MIDAKELRIGNLFKTHVCDNFRIDEIYKDEDWFYCVKNNIGCNGSSLYGFVDDLQPIPLTEGLLLKCGFKKINHIYGYSFFSMERKKSGANIDIYEAYSAIGGNTSVPHIQFLHQLQNLYFALTGKELKIEL